MCSSQPLVMETEADPKRLVTQFSKLTSLKKQFEFICQLGNGAFGKVRLYRDIYFKDMLYAIKTLKKEGIPKAQYDLLIAEVKIHHSQHSGKIRGNFPGNEAERHHSLH